MSDTRPFHISPSLIIPTFVRRTRSLLMGTCTERNSIKGGASSLSAVVAFSIVLLQASLFRLASSIEVGSPLPFGFALSTHCFLFPLGSLLFFSQQPHTLLIPSPFRRQQEKDGKTEKRKDRERKESHTEKMAERETRDIKGRGKRDR